MLLGQPAPFVRAFVDAVDEAIRAQSPSHGMSAMQRTWLAFCVTAVLVTSHSRRRRMLLKINDLSQLAFANIKSIESTAYAFYATSNGQVLN